MDCNRRSCRGCRCAGLALAAVVAVVIGVLFFFAFIPGIVTAVWIAGGLGVLSLLVLFVRLFFARFFVRPGEGYSAPICLCRYGTCLLAGSVGTIVTALAALSVTLTVGNVLVAILIGLGAFFTTLMLYALVSLLRCAISVQCE